MSFPTTRTSAQGALHAIDSWSTWRVANCSNIDAGSNVNLDAKWASFVSGRIRAATTRNPKPKRQLFTRFQSLRSAEFLRGIQLRLHCNGGSRTVNAHRRPSLSATVSDVALAFWIRFQIEEATGPGFLLVSETVDRGIALGRNRAFSESFGRIPVTWGSVDFCLGRGRLDSSLERPLAKNVLLSTGRYPIGVPFRLPDRQLWIR